MQNLCSIIGGMAHIHVNRGQSIDCSEIPQNHNHAQNRHLPTRYSQSRVQPAMILDESDHAVPTGQQHLPVEQVLSDLGYAHKHSAQCSNIPRSCVEPSVVFDESNNSAATARQDFSNVEVQHRGNVDDIDNASHNGISQSSPEGELVPVRFHSSITHECMGFPQLFVEISTGGYVLFEKTGTVEDFLRNAAMEDVDDNWPIEKYLENSEKH